MADCRRIPTMPSPRSRRQPENRSPDWFHRGAGRRLIVDVQRQATPELTRVFGHTGLFLRPTAEHPAELSGNMLAQVLSLHRSAPGFDGQFRCEDDALPLAPDSLSLVFSLFVLESSRDAPALVAEYARVLKPEGVVLIISLNPWSPTRLRWALQAGVTRSAGAVEDLLRNAGLDVLRRHYLGPNWASKQGVTLMEDRRPRLFDAFRAATLIVARRREIPLTPQRKPMPAVGLRTGMSPS